MTKNNELNISNDHMKTFLNSTALFLLFIFVCCSSKPNSTKKDNNKSAVTLQETKCKSTLENDWKDSIVNHYIITTKNPLINSLKNDTINGYAWMYDKDTDRGKNFIAVRIGHSLEDRFATSGWLYIDTITKKVFELDIAKNTLIAVDK